MDPETFVPEGAPQVSGIENPGNQQPDYQAPDIVPGAEGQQQQQQQQQQPPPVSAESIAAAVQQGMQAAQPQPQMTQEEINKQLNVWSPDESFATSLVTALTPNEEGQVNPQALVSVLQSMHQAQMQQAQTYAQATAQQLQQKFGQEVAPLQQHYQTQQQKQHQEDFVKNYPALKPFSSLLQAAATQLQSTGAVFTTKQQLYPALASTMEQMVKAINPQFTLNNAAPTGQQSGISPASLLQGGQPGAAQPAGNQGKSSSIWG